METKEKLAKLQKDRVLKRSSLVKLKRNINLSQRNNSKGNPNRIALAQMNRDAEELNEAIDALNKEIAALEKEAGA